MNDEFLHSLRRQPPARFARELKRKLEAQERRRLWSRRIRTLLLLVAGPALATGIYVLQQTPAENAQAAPPSTPVIAETPPLAAQPSAPVAAPAAPSEFQQTISDAPTPPRPVVRIAASALTDELIRSVLNSSRLSASDAAPDLEQMDTPAAFAAFCRPGATSRLDIVVTSRRVTRQEFIVCRDRGVNELMESKAGYQVLVLTTSRDSDPIRVSANDIYLALSRDIVDPTESGRKVTNSNFTWDQVNRKLPYRPIAIFGPQRRTPLQALLESLLLEPTCIARGVRFARSCAPMRIDSLYTEVEQNASLIPQYLWSEPHGLVFVDYDFYRENRAQLAGSALEGPEPDYATFADGTYPLAQPIYLYVDMGRIARAAQGSEVLRVLLSLQFSGPNRFGLVRLDQREANERTRWHTVNSESDLILDKE